MDPLSGKLHDCVTVQRRNETRRKKMSEKLVEINVISDFLCPWCFLGSMQLGKAIEILDAKFDKKVKFHVKWYPFFLSPGLNRILDKREMYIKKFQGNEEKALAMAANFEKMLEPFGERYTLDGQVGSSLDAHRLCEYIGMTQGPVLQWKLANAMFRKYHSLGLALSEHRVLLDAAEEAGLDRGKADRFLKSDELREKFSSKGQGPFVPDTLDLATQSGVPHVKVECGDMAFEIPGAQSEDYFVRIIDRIVQKSRL